MNDRYEVRITRHAEASMREIAHYIAYDLLAPDAAVNLLMAFQHEIGKLDHTPHRVHLTPEEPWHSAGVRRLAVRGFYVYFWVDEEHRRVQVIDVIYMKRDQLRQLMDMPLDEE